MFEKLLKKFHLVAKYFIVSSVFRVSPLCLKKKSNLNCSVRSCLIYTSSIKIYCRSSVEKTVNREYLIF